MQQSITSLSNSSSTFCKKLPDILNILLIKIKGLPNPFQDKPFGNTVGRKTRTQQKRLPNIQNRTILEGVEPNPNTLAADKSVF